MTNFLIYPAIDGDYSFPDEVNQAIADSPELVATYAKPADITAAVSPKLNASTAATTYAAKSVETSKLDASQKGAASGVAALDSGSRVPETNLPANLAATALNATFVPKWKATTAYLAGDKVLSPGGDIVSAKVNFTSGASFSAANWDYSTTYATPAAVTAAVSPKLDSVTAAGTYSLLNPAGSTVAASRTLALTDAAKVLQVTAATDVTLTLPLDTVTAFPAGAEIDVVPTGAGRVYIKPSLVNLYPDPDQEAGITGWAPRNSATVSNPSNGVGGSKSVRSTSTGTGSYGHFGRVISLASLGLAPGDVISARMWMSPTVGAPSAGFSIRFMIGTTGTQSETTPAYVSGDGLRYATNVTIPVGCDGLRLVTYNSSGIVGSTLDVDQVMLAKSSTQLDTYLDGSVSGYFWTGTASASSSMGPLIIGDQVVPIGGRSKLRHIGGGVWFVSSAGSADAVLMDTDALFVDRDNGQAGIVAPGAVSTRTSTALTANRAYAVRFVPSRRMVITKINFRLSTVSGTDDPVDVGIVSSAGAKLVTSGATTGKLNSTTGTKSVTIAATILNAGTVYYAVLAANSTATLEFAGVVGDAFGTAMPQAEALYKATSYPIPTSLTAMTVTDSAPMLWVRES